MPHECIVEHDAGIAVPQCSGHFTLAEHQQMVQQLLADQSLNASFGLIFDCSHVDVPPNPEEMGFVADSLRDLNHKFPGKKAVIATLPGFVSILEMIGILAGDGLFEAFTNEAAARAWLAKPVG